jgi:hypothetical protein
MHVAIKAIVQELSFIHQILRNIFKSGLIKRCIIAGMVACNIKKLSGRKNAENNLEFRTGRLE